MRNATKRRREAKETKRDVKRDSEKRIVREKRKKNWSRERVRTENCFVHFPCSKMSKVDQRFWNLKLKKAKRWKSS